MVATIVSTTRTTHVTLLTGDQLLVSRNGAILTTVNSVSGTGTGTATRVSIDGEVTSLGSNTALLLTMTSLGSNSTTGIGNHIVSIGSTGLVRSEGNRGVFVSGTGNTVLNAGEIMAQGDGVELTGANGIIRNWGSVSSTVDAALTARGANSEITNAGALIGFQGILSTGADAAIANSGSIVARDTGISSSGISSILSNSGRIEAEQFAVVMMETGVLSNSGALIARSGAAVVLEKGGAMTNTGLVQGLEGGIAAGGSAGLELINEGQISSFDQAVGFLIGELTNAGTISSARDAVVVSSGGAARVLNTGTITAGETGIEIGRGTFASVRNDGLIEAEDLGVNVAGTAVTLRNFGDIRAANGMQVDSGDARVLNAGTITAAFNGIISFGDDLVLRNTGAIDVDGTSGLFMLGLRGLQAINAGTITAAIDGIVIEQNSSTDPAGVVFNSGSVVAGRFGLSATGFESGITLRNSGLLHGDTAGVSAQNGASSIINLGTIAAGPEDGGDRGASVVLGSAADGLRNTGTILGQVEMGAGDDQVTNAGRIEGTVFLGDGNDLYTARNAAQADEVLGGLGNDTLRGGDAADRLGGEVGNDLILGGAGHDTLAGGAGRDTLTGGDGADVFLFRFRSDASSGSQRDSITDMTAGVDRIDLSGFMAGAVFLDSAAYTATGVREIRYNAGSGLLWGDINGDGQTDWGLQLTAGLVLTAADFVL